MPMPPNFSKMEIPKVFPTTNCHLSTKFLSFQLGSPHNLLEKMRWSQVGWMMV